ncbi:putative glycerol-3-phosphate acyltransferase protein [Botrytis fragariae]|uniref:Putative glycerol-3-phosphate acyltransferase protein n=1 Tax=Botrytis fragariae TaxID=1964551 RepID=A0A8H6EHC7_9HELO|nr:putative glycerol-3-phosphate acyltransferase protein [Botrytis fragariae]KAF5872354.1 putative glycerol-3-phosphate acyltransferase protein [Botrytis fragariae]
MADNKTSSPPRTSAPDLEILGDQVTLHPSGYIEPPERPHDGEKERNLVEHMARFRSSPLEFLREVSLHVSGTGWRAYDHFIGQPIFYPGFSENMTAAVMSTPILQTRISELAEKRIGIEEQEGLLNKDDPLYHSKRSQRKSAIEQSLQELSEKLTSDMICKMESIHVSSEEVLRLRNVAEKAQKDKTSIIFLPCHRSHVDYVSLQLICYRLGIALPTVVAGDNLNFPVVGSFLQHAGAMWIRRSFGDDALYTTLVQSYIDTLLQGGYNFECFIEGGRSRTGKLLPPKFGILSFILDSILSGRVKDTIICPVSTQYDKVIETEGYVGELLGIPKKKENLADFLSASSVLSLKLGRVDVRFHEPWSLRDFILQQQARSLGIPKTLDFESINVPSIRQKLLRTLGYKVLSDINAVSVVMPTALVGTVLLTLRGRGVGKSELIRRVEWISERVRNKGGRVAHFAGATTSTVVERALEVLGKDLVGRVDGLAEETYYAVDRFQLSFYRNMTIHLFISEALVSASMYMNVKRGGGKVHQNISYEDLRSQVQFLSQLFRGEFIYPTEGLVVNLDNTLHDLEADNIVELIRDPEGKILTVGLSDHERSVGRENYDFYCFLIWPFVEAFWLGAVSLMGFTPPPSKPNAVWLEVKKAHDGAQLLGKTLYHQGDLSYFEAVNKETLKNAYQRFEDEGIVIVSKSRNSKIPPRSRLAPEWTPQRNPETSMIIAEGKLWDFIEKIAKSRREGKNRRDGATVSTRVLRLADELGQTLFAEGSGI